MLDTLECFVCGHFRNKAFSCQFMGFRGKGVFLDVLQAVIAAVLPLKDDAQMKQYLLEPEARRDMVQETGGQFHSIKGLDEMVPLLADRAFVCLHYNMSSTGELKACGEEPASTEESRYSRCLIVE